MKCSLCGSRVENGVCTFCGMPCTEPVAEETLDKEAVIRLIRESVTTEADRTEEVKVERLPAVYEEHYERRHIHGEQGGSITVSSLMIKAVILIILSIIAYIVILSGPSEVPEGDMPEIRTEDTYLAWR